jgi:hypothetical protein
MDTTVRPSRVTPAHLETFRARLQAKLLEWHVQAQNVGAPPEIELQVGPKYARIAYITFGNAQAYGFVDLSNGDLLKADGWKKPAKHKRGSIFGTDPLAGCGPYGMCYLR